MAQTPEGKVKLAGRKIIKEYDPHYSTPFSGGFGSSGGFDGTILYRRHFIGIEYKATNKDKPTELQIKNAKKAYSEGAVILLIHKDNIETIKNLLEDIKQGVQIDHRKRSVWPYGIDL